MAYAQLSMVWRLVCSIDWPTRWVTVSSTLVTARAIFGLASARACPIASTRPVASLWRAAFRRALFQFVGAHRLRHRQVQLAAASGSARSRFADPRMTRAGPGMARHSRADEWKERLGKCCAPKARPPAASTRWDRLRRTPGRMAAPSNERLDTVTHRVGPIDGARHAHTWIACGIDEGSASSTMRTRTTDLTSQERRCATGSPTSNRAARSARRGWRRSSRTACRRAVTIPAHALDRQAARIAWCFAHQRPPASNANFRLEAITRLHDARTDEDKKIATQRLRADVMKHVSDIAEKYLIAGEPRIPR